MKLSYAVLTSVAIVMVLGGCQLQQNVPISTSMDRTTQTAEITIYTQPGSTTPSFSETTLQKSYSSYELALDYCVVVGADFEEDQVVSVDWFIPFFELNEMRDEEGRLYEWMKPYQVPETQYKVEIPKEIINTYINDHFQVQLDYSNSKYISPDHPDKYVLNAEVYGDVSLNVLDTKHEDEMVIMVCESRFFMGEETNPWEIGKRFEIAIENPESSNFKFLYYRTIE